MLRSVISGNTLTNFLKNVPVFEINYFPLKNKNLKLTFTKRLKKRQFLDDSITVFTANSVVLRLDLLPSLKRRTAQAREERVYLHLSIFIFCFRLFCLNDVSNGQFVTNRGAYVKLWWAKTKRAMTKA